MRGTVLQVVQAEDGAGWALEIDAGAFHYYWYPLPWTGGMRRLIITGHEDVQEGGTSDGEGDVRQACAGTL